MVISPATNPIPYIPPVPTAVEAVAKTLPEKKSGTEDKHGDQASPQSHEKKSTQQLNEEERSETQRLAQRDREVRAHEAAHKGAAGRHARGAAEFEYERGPDGRQYAVGGEVSIDVSRPSDPQAALQKAMIIRRAALAPAQPSAQDRSVAAAAAQMAEQARAELSSERAERPEGSETADKDHSNRIDRAYGNLPDRTESSINIVV